ncbi:TPA: baseplate J/gp47 family protein [Escherichia coli]|nr:baseplate J/gp47 family protein [Escherichia coli]
MPFERPGLSELREKSRSDVKDSLEEKGALLRFASLRILADVTAGMTHLHYGYLDWIALQCTPATATDEYLDAWGTLKGVTRRTAVAATCRCVRFSGTPGSTVSAGAVLNRADSYQYTLDADVTLDSTGVGTGSVTAVLPDPVDDDTGGGENGNADAGTTLTPDTGQAGVSSTVTMTEAATGGTNAEDEDDYRQRVLYAYRNLPQGGSAADYVQWALEVPGVKMAWCVNRVLGPGTVGVFILADEGDADVVGDDGVASDEDWTYRKATGLKLTVADYIRERQPVTAVVYVMSPVEKSIDMELRGLSDATDAVKTQVMAAIDSVLENVNALNGDGVVNVSDLYYAIADINGTEGFILAIPDENITLSQGEIPVRGTVTWSS